jgi:diguanylate cyclase (GGDEF)-like protein
MTLTTSLETLAPLQALVAALVLWLLIGGRGASGAGRWAIGGMGLIAAGLGLTSPALTHTPLQTSLGLTLFSAGLSALWWALSLWLKPSLSRRLMMALPLLIGAVSQALAASPLWARVAADALLGLQLAILFWTLAQPARGQVVQGLHQRRWRLLGLAAVAPLVLANLGRALDAGLELGHAEAANLAMALSGELALLLVLPVLLLAWRSDTEAELARLAQTDGLTGLMDRQALDRRSVDMFSMARRYAEPLALLVLELDGFTTLLEEQGRDAGDRALALFSSCLQTQMRLGDVCGRVGEASFGVIMARCERLGPEALDQRIRQVLAQRAVKELGMALNYSGGWARLRPGDRNLGDLLRRAETALYEARHAGQGQLMAEPGVSD